MTPQERLRKHQRALEKTQRELDRERVKLENQEKKLVQDIKKSAKNGNMGACKIQAKDLVRTRRCVRTYPLPISPPSPLYTLPLCLHSPIASLKSARRGLTMNGHHPWCWWDGTDTYKNSTQCAHNYKRSPSESKPSDPTNR